MNKSELKKIKQHAERQPVMVMYRQNNLFEKYMPEVISNLKELGFDVTEKTFPTGTKPKEIEKWQLGNVNKFKDKLLLTDLTCDNVSVTWGHRIKNISSFVDKIFNNSIADLICKENSNLDKEYLVSGYLDCGSEKNDETLNVQTASYLVSKVKETHDLKKAFVYKDRIWDHDPPSKYLIEYAKKTGNSISDAEWKRNLENEKGNELEGITKKYFKQILTRAGISKEQIVYTTTAETPPNQIDEQNNLIIMDRHAVSDKEISLKNALLLEVPIENMYQSALKQGINLPKNVEAKLKTEINKEIHKYVVRLMHLKTQQP